MLRNAIIAKKEKHGYKYDYIIQNCLQSISVSDHGRITRS